MEGRPLRLPKGGIVRPGEKVEGAKGNYPRELDHFNVEGAEALKALYGDKPQLIRGMFVSNNIREVVDLGYKKWHQNNTIACQGDGRIAIDLDEGVEIECLGEECETVKASKCRRNICIAFIPTEAPTIALHTFSSGGWRTIENTLAFIDLLLATRGHLAGIPWIMIREPYKQKRTTEDGKTVNQVHHCIRFDVEVPILQLPSMELPKLERPAAFDQADPSFYPRSMREAAEQEALPPAAEPIEAAALPEPVEAEVIPAKCEKSGINNAANATFEHDQPALDPNIEIGFDILNLTGQQRKALLDRYQGDDGKLIQYLSAMVDRKQEGKAPVEPEPVPEQKATGTNGKAPSPHWSF